MKFKIKKVDAPKKGNTRTRRVFAWKKTTVGDYQVWLEHYEVHERFYKPVGSTPGWWFETSRNVLEWYY